MQSPQKRFGTRRVQLKASKLLHRYVCLHAFCLHQTEMYIAYRTCINAPSSCFIIYITVCILDINKYLASHTYA